jgi:hypothetical protein
MELSSVQAAQGHFGKSIYKFGFNTAITTTEETVWDEGGIYAYPTAAAVLSVVSSNAADAAAGTGARKVTIEGLDADYNVQTVEITLNGTTPVASTETFIRVYRAFVSEAGSGGTNTGAISISTSSTVRAEISAGQGQTLMAVYTVPADYIGYIVGWSIGSGSSAANKYLDARLIIRDPDGILLTKARTTIHNTTLIQPFPKAIEVAAKSDVEIRAITSSGTDAVSGTFNMMLMRN